MSLVSMSSVAVAHDLAAPGQPLPKAAAAPASAAVRTSGDIDAVIHVRGKGSKDHTVPIEADLLWVIEDYLDSPAIRVPAAARWSARQGLRGGQQTRRYSLDVTASG